MGLKYGWVCCGIMKRCLRGWTLWPITVCAWPGPAVPGLPDAPLKQDRVLELYFVFFDVVTPKSDFFPGGLESTGAILGKIKV